MTLARGSQAQTIYVAESTFGTTPSSPGFTSLPLTGNSLALGKDTFQSQTIRSDRMIEDFRHGMKNVSGDLSFEFRYSDFDAFLAAALMNDWATNDLTVGTTAKYFSIEKGFTDIGRYHLYTGCMVNTFALSIQANSMITGTLGIIGKDLSTGAAPEDSVPADYSSNSPFDSFTGSIYEGGTAASNEIAIVTGIDFTLDNGMTPTQIVGSDTTPEIIDGRSNLTGTLTAYFEDGSMVDKFVNETESVIQFTLQDTASNSYTFLLPAVKYGGGDPGYDGEGPVTASMNFQAIYDATSGTSFKITRSG